MITIHCYTTARHADIIYVMQKGKLVEQGSHGELIRYGGLYAASWRAQMNGGQSDA